MADYDRTPSSRRRRRGGGGTELQETTPPKSPSVSSEGTAPPMRERAAAIRRLLGRRSRSSSSTRATRQLSLPRQQAPTLDHQPSPAAQLWASVRALLGFSSDRYFLSRYQVAASTPLQMTLYFNVPLAIVWAAANQLLFSWKSRIFEVPIHVAVISPMIFWTCFLLEPIRLLLGYVGNLNERVAWLGGFWILTFPQIVAHVYFLLGQNILWFNMPVETWSALVYLSLTLVQLLIGYSTIRRLVDKAMADFHLQPVETADAAVVDRL